MLAWRLAACDHRGGAVGDQPEDDLGGVLEVVTAERAQLQQPARPVADRRGLDGVLLFLPVHKRPPTGPTRLGPADLRFRAVDPQPHPSAAAKANTSAGLRRRSPGLPGTANPRWASSRRISPAAG
jgi:hypothetical protein